MKDKTFFHKTCYRNDWQHLSKIEYLYSLVAQTVKNLPAVQETWVRSLGWEDSPGEGNGYPLQYSCWQNSMDRGAWQATVHEVSKMGHDCSNLPHTAHI